MYCRSVPCWPGIWSIGRGTNNNTLGITSGITPKSAYLSNRSATRPSAGIAGNGNPLGLDWPISVSVELDPLSPGEIWLLVITPSISTLLTPLTVATITTRMNNRGKPPVNRNRICNGDCLSILKVSLNPLWPTSSTCTSTSANASITALGGVNGMIGPIIRLNCTLLSSTGHSRYALRHRDVDDRARCLQQCVGPDRPISVANQPVDPRISQVVGGQKVQPVPLPYAVLRHRGIILGSRLGHDPPRQVSNALAIGCRIGQCAGAVIPAVGRECDRRHYPHLNQRL